MRYNRILVLSSIPFIMNYISANLDCGNAEINGNGCVVENTNDGDFTIETNITTDDVGAIGFKIVQSSNNNTIFMVGDIVTEGDTSVGIQNLSSNNVISMTGDITASGQQSAGIMNFGGEGNIMSIIGNIKITGSTGYAIWDIASDDNTISIKGDVTTEGYEARAILNQSNNNNISIMGDIATSGDYAVAITEGSNDSVISIMGDITTSGHSSHGLQASGDGNNISVTGNITSTGDVATGVLFDYNVANNTVTVDGNLAAKNDAIVFNNVIPTMTQTVRNNIVNVNGTVSSTTGGIWFKAGSADNTVYFAKGSKFIGTITNDGDNTNTLQFDVGPALSYIFAVAGDLGLQDTSKPVVSGSANSRSVADMDDTYNRLYQRFVQLDNELVLQHQANYEGNKQRYNISGYVNKSERTLFNSELDARNTGVTLGYQLNDQWDVLANAEKLEIEYGSSEHILNTTSGLIGLYAPNYKDVLSGSLSVRLLAGFSKNEGELKVLNNTVATGEEIVTDSYNTMTLLGGTDWLKKYSDSQFRKYLHLSLNLIYENQPKYESSKYFTMHDNSTTQLNTSFKHVISYQPTSSRYNINGVVGVTYANILSGEEHSYAITSLNNITTETSYTATKDKLYYEGIFSLSYNATDNTSVRLGAQMSKTNEQEIDSLSGSLSIHMVR